ncbi:MAG: hypothetical protein AAB319_08970 [Pseudomonadota bacterium]
MQQRYSLILAASILLGVSLSAQAQQHDLHQQQMMQGQQAQAKPAEDARQLVLFPQAMRLHTLANMRDHLLALQEIQIALSKEDYDTAAAVAEQRLGMSSLKLHGAHDVAPFMPAGLRNIGTEIHRAASRLATDAGTASATGDVKPVLASMARVTQQCIACHAVYRVQ